MSLAHRGNELSSVASRSDQRPRHSRTTIAAWREGFTDRKCDFDRVAVRHGTPDTRLRTRMTGCTAHGGTSNKNGRLALRGNTCYPHTTQFGVRKHSRHRKRCRNSSGRSGCANTLNGLISFCSLSVRNCAVNCHSAIAPAKFNFYRQVTAHLKPVRTHYFLSELLEISC